MPERFKVLLAGWFQVLESGPKFIQASQVCISHSFINNQPSVVLVPLRVINSDVRAVDLLIKPADHLL